MKTSQPKRENPMKYLAAVGVIAVAVIVGCGGPSEEQRAEADQAVADAAKAKVLAEEAQASADECVLALDPTVRALINLSAKLDINVDYDEYESLTTNANVKFEQVRPEAETISDGCAEVTDKLGASLVYYLAAAEEWDECNEDYSCVGGALDKSENETSNLWSKAGNKVDLATAQLQELQDNAVEAEADAEEKAEEAKALQAEVDAA